MMLRMAAAPPIATKIKRRRQALRMTQEDLAGSLGVAKATVANWESGKHFPLRHLGAVEEVLGISLTEDGDSWYDQDDPIETAIAEDPSLPQADKRAFIAQLRTRRSL